MNKMRVQPSSAQLMTPKTVLNQHEEVSKGINILLLPTFFWLTFVENYNEMETNVEFWVRPVSDVNTRETSCDSTLASPVDMKYVGYTPITPLACFSFKEDDKRLEMLSRYQRCTFLINKSVCSDRSLVRI